ncbi:TolC family protein [Acanthopleuribacter pedis]|uniref:TolC family protein n=1 Tax=Acanthopleuribacter pedis TaxID=442870 RepID=A0A8J7U2B0_9BACT|nr:TolC family protein [Acanthopleuribacter pedis]MBO1319113.1 TolC family protein [Acanthopleuribacter pedis]
MDLRWLKGLGLCTLLFSPIQAQQTKTITLQEALKTAVERNLDIELQRVNIEDQRFSLDLTRARYEPQVTGSLSSSNQEGEAQDADQGQAGSTYSDKTRAFNTTFQKSEDFGLEYSVRFNNSLFDSSQASRQLFGEIYSSSINFSATQQLLRGFNFDEEVYRRDQFVAKGNYHAALEDLNVQMVTVLKNTEDAYWDLVFAVEDLKVAQQSLDLAKQLYEQNRVKIEVGTLAPIELVNNEADIASRENDIVTKENAIRAAEDRLKRVMNLPLDDWRQHLTPADPIVIEAQTPDLTTAFQTALENRPEAKKNAIELENARLDLKYQKNQKLPGLSVTAGYGTSASSANDIDLQTGEVLGTGSWSDALSDAASFDLPGWQIQLDLTWAPFNQQAKLNHKKAELTMRRRQLEIEQNNLTIFEEVRAAIRELESSAKAIKAQEKTLKFREENLKAEEQKFQNGLSTNYRVSEVQEQLAQARTQLISSKVAYKKALTRYHQAVGKLSQHHNISL